MVFVGEEDQVRSGWTRTDIDTDLSQRIRICHSGKNGNNVRSHIRREVDYVFACIEPLLVQYLSQVDLIEKETLNLLLVVTVHPSQIQKPLRQLVK